MSAGNRERQVAGVAWQGRSALVTGASSGIGAAIALALAGEGADLLLAGRDQARLREVADNARRGPGRVATAAGDLAAESEVDRLAARAEALFSRLDLLAHSAGAVGFGEVASTPASELDRLFGINLRAPFLLTRRLLPLLRAARGHLVFINSLAVRRPPAGLAAYTATKAALAALADVLRAEEGEAGVAVLSVFPGRTATAMQQELRRLEGQPYEPAGLLQPREVAAAVVAALALPPGAEITDLDLRPRRGRAR